VKKLFALSLAGLLGVAGLLALNTTPAQAAAPVAPMSAVDNAVGIGPFATYAAAHEVALELVASGSATTAVVIRGADGYYYVGAAN
jgi:hypothetical protein